MTKLKWQQVDGILLLNKPEGISSNQALQRVRRLFNAKKAGHTGSLDPFATGMLPICFGEATKFSQIMLDASKSYQAVGIFGAETDTGDKTGVEKTQAALPQHEQTTFAQILKEFVGEIEQIPPMYSALKQQGKRLYELARMGQVVDRPARQVKILSIGLKTYQPEQFGIEVKCSKGTYIRTLIEDIAKQAGSLAYTSQLHRTAVDPFTDQKMYTLDELQDLQQENPQVLSTLLLGVDAGLGRLPELVLLEDEAHRIIHGQTVQTDQPDALYRAYDQNKLFLGLVQSEQGMIKAKRLVRTA